MRFKIFWDLLGTYAFLATFSNTESTLQESIFKSVCLSVMFLVIACPLEPLDVATINYAGV